MSLSDLAHTYEWRVERLHKGSSVLILQLAADLGKSMALQGCRGGREYCGRSVCHRKDDPGVGVDLALTYKLTPKLLIVRP